ncbi:DUF7527 domain-containing protein [Halospeciosus flavus]|uniref:DUF7527 domain-containing protein n=1 Tax=Halospeciosus flavus TaxID=3032283 RepID=A0ABD5Z2I0_9EURY|nr:hypothetical protein [Halospeciosus flavus]
MQTRTVDHVESWESRPFSGGYRALHDLADASFSGAVVADDTWLFALNGRVVGVFEGDVEDFADASGTVYEAPHLSLPLLFAMLETGGETRATYYTEDTPLSETDETLTDGNFVGYVELSENVLSGDYFTVYYGGRSMSAAFVGASEETVTGEEAFERAADEVGLYEVVSVDLDIVDLPEPEEPVDEPVEEPTDESTDESTAAAETGAAAVGAVDADSTDTTSVDSNDDADADAVEATADATETADVTSVDSGVGSEPERPDEAAAHAATETGLTPERSDAADTAGTADTADAAEPVDVKSEEAEETDTEPADESTFAEEEAWRETTSVPAIDPDESRDSATDAAASGATARGATDGTGVADEPASGAVTETDVPADRRERDAAGVSAEPAETETATSADESRVSERVQELQAAVAERDERIESLEEALDEAERRLDDRRAELDRLHEERDDLAARVETLEEQLAEARANAATATGHGNAGQSGAEDRSPAEALSGTNLFVRYESKADPTLDALESGDATAEQINANLRLEHHTRFDATDVTVDGERFERFLETSAPYRFVSWAVRELPYEILDTGHRSGLSDLFEAVAQVDRAELDGTVAVPGEDGSEVSHTFDVVLRDRMGNPLVVADLEESRDPVTGDAMDDLVGAARTVASGSETLASAIYVTSSFFEPGALEVADESVDEGGFLRGSDKDSFVKVSRKRGFHLCLVEDRNESFHVTVPEL